MIRIENSREVFFDDYLVDTEETTAEMRLHRPVRRPEPLLVFDKPWEGDRISYLSVIKDTDRYRMYYLASSSQTKEPFRFCYAESKDGLKWEKPALGIYDYNGSYDNNIIIYPGMIPELTAFDNMKVFIDEHPLCPAEEKYKAVMAWCGHTTLIYIVSEDAIHWRWGGIITDKGEFDSHNLAFYDKVRKKYFCYFRAEHEPKADQPEKEKSILPRLSRMLYDPERGMHKAPPDGDTGIYFMRDVRVIESNDFKSWSEPVLLDFGEDADDIQLYTNAVMPYPRAPQVLVGFPTRYIERKAWTKNYDELSGKENRLRRIRGEAREGLALTDCAFMVSRDGYKWKRYDEAFIIPGAEHDLNWGYGDCYPSPYLMESAADSEGADGEYSLLITEGHNMVHPEVLYRHTIRKDGFVSLHAGGKEARIMTKPFVYRGKEMRVNIESSARGYAYFTLIDTDGERYTSVETFGNSIDKRVHFDDGVIDKLMGQEVRLEVRLLDCDLYAVGFYD